MKSVKILLSSLALLLIVGCTTTVTPVDIHANVPSLDGNDPNSGLVELLPDHSAVLTMGADSRYQGLCIQYGKKFTPPLTGAESVIFTNNVFTNIDGKVITLNPFEPGHYWHIDAEHLAKFGQMNRWKKEGVK